jgi:hypothetical protein
LRVLLSEGDATALSATLLAKNDDDALTRVKDLLNIHAVVRPRAPVAAGSLYHRVPPDHDAVHSCWYGPVPQVPDHILIEHPPEGVNVFHSASDQLDVLLGHSPLSISRRQADGRGWFRTSDLSRVKR